MYLYLHAAKLLEVLRIQIADGEPRLPDGVTWHDHREFARRFVNALAARVGEFDLSRSAVLREIVHPADPYAAIDGGRVMLGLDSSATADPSDPRHGALGLRDWSEAAGGALVRDVPYWWRSGVPSAMVLSVGGALVGRPVGELRHVPDERLDVALRRWIALRMSWLARQSSVDLAAVDVDQVIAAADGDAKVVTLDARVAISALLAEARAPFDPRIHVHGFVGPDEWYAG